MKAAYDRVVGNSGCAGVDGMEVSELKLYLKNTLAYYQGFSFGRELSSPTC